MSVVLSLPVRCSAHLGDDGEPGDVVHLVFDVLGEDVEPVGLGRGAAGDGGGELLALGELGGGGRRDDLHLRGLRQVLAQPVAALRKGLRLGVDPAHLAPLAPAEQAVVDSQPDLGPDLEVRAA